MNRDQSPAPIGDALNQLRQSGAVRPASDLPMPEATPMPMRASGMTREALEIETSVVLRGRHFRLRCNLKLDDLDKLCDRLDAVGAEPPPLPAQYSPNGEPICPKHQAPMKEREKQGDTWFSHKLVDAQGQEHFCKGRPGKDSPGWTLA